MLLEGLVSVWLQVPHGRIEPLRSQDALLNAGTRPSYDGTAQIRCSERKSFEAPVVGWNEQPIRLLKHRVL